MTDNTLTAAEYSHYLQARKLPTIIQRPPQRLYKGSPKRKNDAVHRVQLAKLLLNKPSNESKIIKLLDEASAIAPNNPRLMLQKSAFLIALKHYDAAFKIALKLDQLTPKSGVGQILQGDIYLAQKN